MILNSDQRAALEAVQRRENIFLTGPAGSGKSTLIRAILDWAAQAGINASTTAMTGCAAILLGAKAKTLHSWAGIGLGRAPVDKLIADINKTYPLKRRWRTTQLLIVDECSMMPPELFEKLDQVGRRIRGRPSLSWGGIQLVLCGDFFQLPPVVKPGQWQPQGQQQQQHHRFVFETEAWKQAALRPVCLTRIERQTDAAFQTLLNEARIGALSEISIAILKSRQGLAWKALPIRPTLLFSRNADVDAINEANVAALKKPMRSYDATTVVEAIAGIVAPTGEALERIITRMDSDSSYTPHLELCEGCQVMLVHNMDLEAGLVNGSRGVVVAFRTEDQAPIVQFMHGDPVCIEPHDWISNDCEIVKRRQIPLRVAYAVTIHKSQGATLDCALVDIGSSTFECGQAYVALSRVRDLSSLYVWNFNPTRVMADPVVVEFYKSLYGVAAEVVAEVAEVATEMPTIPTIPPTPPPSPILAPQPINITATATATASTNTNKWSGVHESWVELLDTWAASEQGAAVLAAVERARETTTVYPPREQVFAALQVPRDGVRVVLLAQDPYHGPGQAHGLAFSVPTGTPLPPSLKNIRKEFLADGGTEEQWPATKGDLTDWATHGTLLLNTTWTVEAGKAASHAGLGWDSLTKLVLEAVLATNTNTVFVAWGKHAQGICKKLRIDAVVQAAHPSPLSANQGFFGSRPFSTVRGLLKNDTWPFPA